MWRGQCEVRGWWGSAEQQSCRKLLVSRFVVTTDPLSCDRRAVSVLLA